MCVNEKENNKRGKVSELSLKANSRIDTEIAADKLKSKGRVFEEVIIEDPRFTKLFSLSLFEKIK